MMGTIIQPVNNYITKAVFALVILFTSQACQDQHWLLELNEPPEFADVGELNPNVSDNAIYIPKSIWYYDYSIITKDGVSKPLAIYDIEGCTGTNCIKSTIDSIPNSQLKVAYIQLSIFENKGPTGMSDNQTVVKYSLLNEEKKRIANSSITGIVENEERIFIHPPRMHYFARLEISPFPIIELRKESYSLELYIPSGQFDIPEKTEGYITNSYQVTGPETYTFKGEVFDVTRYNFRSENTQGSLSQGYFLFSKVYGVVYYQTTFASDSTTLSYSLVDYDRNSK